MKKSIRFAHWFSMLCLLAACNTLEVRIEDAPERTVPSPQVATVATSPVPSVAPPGDSTSGMVVSPPQGLVFQTDEGAWITNAGGEAALFVEGQDVQILPDGAWALHTDGDLWLTDVATGQRRNLTNTPDHYEGYVRWGPQRPGTVVFGALPRQLAPEPGWTGFLAAVDLDGSHWRILDDQHHVAGPPAFSPDGQTIAYSGGSTGRLYDWESGEVVDFDPLDYGLADILPGVSDGVQIGSPAWSPDGQQIAWVIAGEMLSPDGSIGVGLFDLQARTARLLYLYYPLGMAGWPPMPIWGADGRPMSDAEPIPAPVWSPDGRWLALVTLAQDPRQKMLRIAPVDGQGEQQTLGLGVNPVWSPDGRWLAFQKSFQEGSPPCLVVETGVWEMIALDVPIGEEGRLVSWVHNR